MDIAVQSNNSLNMRKSLTIISKVQKRTKVITFQLKIKANQSIALNGTAHCLTVLNGMKHFTKTRSKTEMVSDTFTSQDSRYKRYIKKNECHK